MLLKVVTVALWAAVAGVCAADAQTLASIGGPRELPPAGYTGQMFVDSRGCVFLRAGVGGQVNWVPRVDRQRHVLCGYPPTVGGRPAMQMAQAPAPVVRPAPVQQRATGAPMQTIASLTTPPAIQARPAAAAVAPARYVAAPVQRVALAQPQIAAAPLAVGVGGEKIGCYGSAPVPQVYATSTGGRVVLCTRGDGTLTGARAPIYDVVALGVGNRAGAGIYEGRGGAVQLAAPAPTGRSAAPLQQVAVRQAVAPMAPVPRGYKPAWTDDRLNPRRGIGTAQGWAQQDQIWTRTVPAQLVAAQPVRRRVLAVSTQSQPGQYEARQPAPQAQVRVSTMASSTAAAGGLYVQVGSFGQPANADGARARLQAAGLPVGTARVSKGGKALQIVLAGPFGDTGSAQAALAAARGAGFGDAFIR